MNIANESSSTHSNFSLSIFPKVCRAWDTLRHFPRRDGSPLVRKGLSHGGKHPDPVLTRCQFLGIFWESIHFLEINFFLSSGKHELLQEVQYGTTRMYSAGSAADNLEVPRYDIRNIPDRTRLPSSPKTQPASRHAELYYCSVLHARSPESLSQMTQTTCWRELGSDTSNSMALHDTTVKARLQPYPQQGDSEGPRSTSASRV